MQESQVGDHSSDISYNNICKQVNKGIKEGFHDRDSLGCAQNNKAWDFQRYVINKDDLTLTELKGFLQAHLREKKLLF